MRRLTGSSLSWEYLIKGVRLVRTKLLEGEKVLAWQPARVYKSGRFRGWRGWLRVTNLRIIFEAHFLFWEKHVEIAIDEVAEVKKKRALGLIPNIVYVRTKAGQEYDFVTWPRQRIINLIQG